MFNLRTLPDSNDKTLLAEIQRVADLVPNGPLTRSIFLKHGQGMKRITNRFGEWHTALVAAGLAHRRSDVFVGRGSHASLKLSDDDILKALRALAIKLGTDLMTVSQVETHLPFGRAVLAKRWGSCHTAFKAAGLQVAPLGRRYTAEDCYVNLLNVWTYHGRQPKYSEMSLSPSEVGGKAYIVRFGTWNRALAAFVDRVNVKPTHTPDQSNSETNASALQQDTRSLELPTSLIRKVDERREVPLGLRYRILHRDLFKCVLCGDHPAKNPECSLHIDHIIPWSKGGKTREDNLRSLCASCNIGKGDRVLD